MCEPAVCRTQRADAAASRSARAYHPGPRARSRSAACAKTSLTIRWIVPRESDRSCPISGSSNGRVSPGWIALKCTFRSVDPQGPAFQVTGSEAYKARCARLAACDHQPGAAGRHTSGEWPFGCAARSSCWPDRATGRRHAETVTPPDVVIALAWTTRGHRTIVSLGITH